MIINNLSEILDINNSVIIIGSGPAGISTAIKLEKNRIKTLIVEAGDIETEEYDVTTGNHQLGGTRMGYNKNDSVVDKNLKVHSIENLYINGSSVSRTEGHCHPTYTIV